MRLFLLLIHGKFSFVGIQFTISPTLCHRASLVTEIRDGRTCELRGIMRIGSTSDDLPAYCVTISPQAQRQQEANQAEKGRNEKLLCTDMFGAIRSHRHQDSKIQLYLRHKLKNRLISLPAPTLSLNSL